MLSMALLATSAGTLWIQLGAAVTAGVAVWLVRQRRNTTGPRPLSIPLTSQHAVHVIETGNVRLVVGTGPGAAPRLLCELDRLPAPAPPPTWAPPCTDRPAAAVSAYRPRWDERQV